MASGPIVGAMILLRWVGVHAGSVLLCGLVGVGFFPDLSAFLRPFLPMLVSLVLGLAIARMDVGSILRDFANPRKLALMLAALVAFVPLTCLALVGVGTLLGASPETILALAVFGASPPLSSAASLALMLGYDARMTLQFGSLATLALPLLGPLTMSLVGIDVDVAVLHMAFRIAAMVAGGFAIGLGLQAILGRSRIAAHRDAFNGAATIGMLLFLFPLFDGVLGFARAEPLQAAGLLALAVMLNFGGHIAVSIGARRVADLPRARAAGLMFGNRNVSFYLAVLPLNPALGLFVAASQIPIYATPAVFGRRK
ncbi:hypothetical protein G5B39_10190 [Rhodobacteraceae bacterium SC52]|nr:hypothetical protein G5B39_10190 [Rhodobacteraceae bacterium SC52]